MPPTALFEGPFDTGALPDDVLYRIFMEVRDQKKPRRRSTPVVAQVCNSWRSAAINAHCLWTTVRFSKPKNPSLPHQTLMIQRSGNTPLDVIIENLGDYNIFPVIMSILLPHVHRWRSLRIIRLEEDPFSKIFDDLRDVSAPALEELVVRQLRHRGGYVFRPFSEGAPNLRVLEIGSDHFDIHSPFYNRLSNLRIKLNASNGNKDCSISDLFVVLSYVAGTLEELVVEWCGSVAPSPSSLPVVLPKLTSLSFDPEWRYEDNYVPKLSPGRASVGWARTILSGIRGPVFRDFGGYIHQSILQPFVAPSSFPFPGLHALHVRLDPCELSDHSVPLSTFVSVLRQLPVLRELSANNAPHFDPRILDSLAPELHTLVIDNDEYSLRVEICGFGAAVQSSREAQGFSKISWIHFKGLVLVEEEFQWLKENIETFKYDPNPMVAGPYSPLSLSWPPSGGSDTENA